MPTLSPTTKSVKVVAILGRQRERVLVDEPLTLDALALLQPISPLSRAFLDGAGMEYRPVGIAVYVDGKRVWSERCPHHGATDAYPDHHNKRGIKIIPFTDAFPEDWMNQI